MMSIKASTTYQHPKAVWVLVGAAFINAVGFGLVSPVLPAYARSFDVGVAAASIVVSAFAFFRLIFAPVAGRLIRTLSEPPVYLVGLFVGAGASVAAAFAGSYVQLLLFRGLSGIGSTFFTIAATSLLIRLAPPLMRGRVTSLHASAFLSGGMIGPVLGGLVAEYGMRMPFIVYAAALLIAACVVWIGLRKTPLQHSVGESDRSTLTVKEAFLSPTYRAVLAASAAHGWTNFGVRMAVLPLLAAAVLNEPWVVGTALAIGAVGTMATLQISGRLADSIGRRPLVVAGLGVTAVAVTVIGFVPSLDPKVGTIFLFTLTFIMGIGAGLIGPGQQAALADIIGNERNGGPALSLFQMMQDGGAIIGPVLVGIVADLTDFYWAFILTALVCFAGLLPWLKSRTSTATSSPKRKSQTGKWRLSQARDRAAQSDA